MTATLRTKKERPNYYIVIRYKDDVTNKPQEKWITTNIPIKGNNKRRAQDILKEVLAEHERHKVDLSSNILFLDFMRQWLENLKHSLSPTTYSGYKVILNNQITPFFEPKRIRVKDLTPAHIQDYVNYKMKSISPNTIIKHLRNISKCLDSAVRQNLIAFNPTKRIEMPKKVKYTGAKHYNEKQIEQLLKCSKGDPLEMVVLLTVFYGFRRSEVLGLKWSAIDMDAHTITIKHTVTYMHGEMFMMDATKNDSSYDVIPLGEMIKTELLRWKARQVEYKKIQPNDYFKSDYVCTRFDGRLIKPDYVTDHFETLLRQSNMPIIRFHDLRHSSAGYLKYLGFDLKDIQTWLRHGDIQTTANLYLSLDMDAKKEIASKLNERFVNFTN
ncbi:MAG: site-specific integrase [Defluviitaleaceae bacterium]|nr:site-specific integrase [Defluviitaleaceae bacterium]MCL2273459.1 site-specific integrase [Defluviitaleaceae bacterium]